MIVLKVYINEDAARLGKCQLERHICPPPGVRVPFEEIISSMKFLFGANAVVQFNVECSSMP